MICLSDRKKTQNVTVELRLRRGDKKWEKAV